MNNFEIWTTEIKETTGLGNNNGAVEVNVPHGPGYSKDPLESWHAKKMGRICD